jgi:DNA-binding Xre family transcriptional regulator
MVLILTLCFGKLWIVKTFLEVVCMPFSYNKLWKILIDKNMNKVALRDAIGITPATLSKMSKNQPVSMDVLAKVCKELDCNIGDIVDYIKD